MDVRKEIYSSKLVLKDVVSGSRDVTESLGLEPILLYNLYIRASSSAG